MAQDFTDNAESAPRKEGQRVYLWSRSSQGHVGEGTPHSGETTTTTAAAASAAAATGATPKTPLSPQKKKLEHTEFQDNFPPHGNNAPWRYPSIIEAVNSIKSEDFISVTKTPCARDGFLTGIATGAGVGGLRYVIRGSPIKAANWAVVSFLLGCVGRYEYCQYLRRQERIKMKRTVEVYQETMAEKRRQELEQFQQKTEDVAKENRKAWYKLW